jgi:hypothetical protein
MKCPRCKIINPDTATRCDCGFDFNSGRVEGSLLTSSEVAQIYGKPRESFVSRKIGPNAAAILSVFAGLSFLFDNSLPNHKQVGFIQFLLCVAVGGSLAAYGRKLAEPGRPLGMLPYVLLRVCAASPALLEFTKGSLNPSAWRLSGLIGSVAMILVAGLGRVWAQRPLSVAPAPALKTCEGCKKNLRARLVIPRLNGQNLCDQCHANLAVAKAAKTAF